MMRDSSDAKVREARASRRTGRSQPRRQYERQSGEPRYSWEVYVAIGRQGLGIIPSKR